MNKVLNWVKKYWYLLLIAGSGMLIVVVSIFFRGKSKALVEAFMKNRDGMLEQVKKIDQLNEKSNEKKNKALEEHVAERDKLDANKEKKLDAIEEERERRAKELSDRESEDLADAMRKGFKL
jgi:biopolymer transport protein ExbB/TolQ